jgi:hypothetical protein
MQAIIFRGQRPNCHIGASQGLAADFEQKTTRLKKARAAKRRTVPGSCFKFTLSERQPQNAYFTL